jgi:H/ACA ribonucleoprotein complex subunit 2
LILAGNITPIDVITHLPVLAEENNIPYVFVPSKEELGLFARLLFSFVDSSLIPFRFSLSGAASATKRPTSCVLVLKPANDEAPHAKYFNKVKEALQESSSKDS